MLAANELARSLTNYRIKRNIYQKDLAKEIGVSTSSVVKIENIQRVTPRIHIIVENFLKEKGEI